MDLDCANIQKVDTDAQAQYCGVWLTSSYSTSYVIVSARIQDLCSMALLDSCPGWPSSGITILPSSHAFTTASFLPAYVQLMCALPSQLLQAAPCKCVFCTGISRLAYR